MEDIGFVVSISEREEKNIQKNLVMSKTSQTFALSLK